MTPRSSSIAIKHLDHVERVGAEVLNYVRIIRNGIYVDPELLGEQLLDFLQHNFYLPFCKCICVPI